MRIFIISLLAALTASLSPASAQTVDVSPEAAARAYDTGEARQTLSVPECRVPGKAWPITGTVLGPTTFLAGGILASAGTIDMDGDYSRGQRAMRGTGFALMATGVAATIVSAIYLHRARHGICKRKGKTE